MLTFVKLPKVALFPVPRSAVPCSLSRQLNLFCPTTYQLSAISLFHSYYR
ncbi:hypothetical protein [Moorena sp. SIO4G3]|nr:hypothetical protein [Moorena sp. SIO4G3]NEO80037.1 hypothetical protein [Moorena sp. SIO4G3]